MHVACKNIEEPQQKNDPFTKNAANIFFSFGNREIEY